MRADWKFENGKIYRRSTIKDVNIDQLTGDIPKLPQWILDRIAKGQQTSMDIKSLTEEIRRVLAEKMKNPQDQQSASLN